MTQPAPFPPAPAPASISTMQALEALGQQALHATTFLPPGYQTKIMSGVGMLAGLGLVLTNLYAAYQGGAPGDAMLGTALGAAVTSFGGGLAGLARKGEKQQATLEAILKAVTPPTTGA
jgi:hypothetical protein